MKKRSYIKKLKKRQSYILETEPYSVILMNSITKLKLITFMLMHKKRDKTFKKIEKYITEIESQLKKLIYT